jgi:hypothetical protein
MGPNWQQQQMRQQQQRQQQQRQQQQRQQQLMREQMERMRKQQESWREQQQKGYLWQQQQKKNQPNLDFNASKRGKNKLKGNIPPLTLNSTLTHARTPIKAQEKKGGCAQVVSFVVTLAFLAFAIYGLLWVVNAF